VWFIDLREAAPAATRMNDVLSVAERSRAEKFHFEKDRVKYIIAHCALRQILAGYLHTDPSGLEFLEGPHGKPKLVLRSFWPTLNFNLSHSHEAALVAVILGRNIGVDIEYIKPGFQWQEIAARFFAPGEIEILLALRPEQQQRAFFQCWTRKEAYIKGKGGGLSIPLQDFEVSLAPGERAALRSHKADPEEVKRWAFSEIDFRPDYAAAVAIEGHDGELKCFNWSGQWPEKQ
jgi:4'-phosphopantetheinyl transferase